MAVSMDFALEKDGSRLRVSDGERAVALSGPAPEPAQHRPTDARSAERNLTKTGGTPFFVERFAAEVEPDLVMSASALNALRREALDRLLERRGETRSVPRADESAPASAPGRGGRGSPPSGPGFIRLSRFRRGRSTQSSCFLWRASPPRCWSAGATGWWASCPPCSGRRTRRPWRKSSPLCASRAAEVWGENIYAIPLSRRLGLGLRGGAGLNILNTAAVRHFEGEGLLSVTASFELSMKEIKALGGAVPLGVMAYGYLPLMRLRNCPERARVGCASAPGGGSSPTAGASASPWSAGRRSIPRSSTACRCTSPSATCGDWTSRCCILPGRAPGNAPPSPRISASGAGAVRSAPADCIIGSCSDKESAKSARRFLLFGNRHDIIKLYSRELGGSSIFPL